MNDIPAELQKQGCTAFKLTLASLGEDSCEMSFLLQKDAQLPPVVSQGSFSYGPFWGVRWSRQQVETTTGRIVHVVFKGLVAILKRIPMVLYRNPYIGSSSSDDRLVKASSYLRAASNAAAHYGISIVYPEIDTLILAISKSSSRSVWDVVEEVLAWCPKMATRCQGKCLFIGGANGSAALIGEPPSIPAAKASGWVQLPDMSPAASASALLYPGPDLSSAGSLSDGSFTLSLPAVQGTCATGWIHFTMAPAASGWLKINGVDISVSEDSMGPEDWAAAINAANCGVSAAARGEYVDLTAKVAGSAGNGITLVSEAGGSEYEPISGSTLTGGQDGERTLADMVDAINSSALAVNATAEIATLPGLISHATARIEVGDRGTKYRFTLYVYRGSTRVAALTKTSVTTLQQVADDINANVTTSALVQVAVDGSALVFTAVEGGESGNELRIAIAFTQSPLQSLSVQLAGADADQGIRLTASAAGSAGNDLVFDSSGCFGDVDPFSGGADGTDENPEALLQITLGELSVSMEEYPSLVEAINAAQSMVHAWYEQVAGFSYPRIRLESVSEGNPGFFKLAASYPPESALYGHEVLTSGDALTGGADALQPTAPLSFHGLTERSVSDSLDNAAPSVVGTYGQFELTVPEGADPYQMGAELFYLKSDRDQESYNKRDFPRAAAQAAGQVMQVKGLKLIPYYRNLSDEEMRDAAQTQPGCKEFWQRFGLHALDLASPTFGRANLHVLDKDTEAANYDVNANCNYVHIEGSFPASKDAMDNVPTLKWQNAVISQYAWMTFDDDTPTEVMQLFDGRMRLPDGSLAAYTLLQLQCKLINRPYWEYMTGTNALPNEGKYVWYEPIEDEEKEEHPTKEEVKDALKEYLANAGGNDQESEIVLHRVDGFPEQEFSLDAPLLAMQSTALCVSATWDAAAHEVTVKTGTRRVIGLSEWMRRWLASKKRNEHEQHRLMSHGSDAEPMSPERTGYPMIAPSATPSHSTDHFSQGLEPFQLYRQSGEWWLNGGIVPCPGDLQELPPQKLSTWMPYAKNIFIHQRWVDGVFKVEPVYSI